MHNAVTKNFNEYDLFLSSQKNCYYYGAFQSLKMMYSIHMTFALQKPRFFLLKQVVRLFLKLCRLPFVTSTFSKSLHPCSILKTVPDLDRKIIQGNEVELVTLQIKIGFNKQTLSILKHWIAASKILLEENHLHTIHIIALLHRLLDYFLTFTTVEFGSVTTLLMENDRLPTSKALIDKARILNIHTVKFDYWLLDPIHHNDVYCDTYYCPSDYHKAIALNSTTGKQLNIVQGGFPNWDHLSTLRVEKVIEPFIVYFTQPTVPLKEHQRYIDDLSRYATNYKIIIKVHPREDISHYIPFASQHICVIGKETDSYELLRQGDMFFSIFSTISLEAKHLCEYSFFINYTLSEYSSPINYDQIGLDVITDSSTLSALFNRQLHPMSKETFIAHNNFNYPNSVEKLFGLCRHE